VASSILSIKTGIKEQLATISGARAYATVLPNPSDNALCVVGPQRWTYSRDFDGGVQYFFEVAIYLAPGDLVRAQTRLDAFLAPTGAASIKAAVEGGVAPFVGRLGGACDYARVVGGTEYGRLVDVAGSQMLYAAVEVEVVAS
jgi:hypothetical protein